MASRKKPASTEIIDATPTSTALTPLQHRMAAMASTAQRELAKSPSGASQGISFRNGIMTFAGERVPGDKMNIVVLAPGFERTYYEGAYDANNTSPPSCYSFDGEAPHEDSADPQAERCQSCPNNEWGSAQQGTGKACKEGMRLTFIPVGKAVALDKAREAPIITAKFSVMNTKHINPIVSSLYGKFGHPAKAVMELSVQPDPRIQLRNDLQFVTEIEDDDVLTVLMDRAEDAQAIVKQPYPVIGDRSDTQPRRAPAKKPAGRRKY